MTQNSIRAFLKEIKEQGILVSVNKLDLDIKAPKGKMTKDILTELRARKTEIINYFGGAYIEENQIEKIENLTGDYRMSPSQHRLWVLSQFEEGSLAYNMPNHVLLNGKYDLNNFKRAINSTIDRHEILRTVFKENQKGEIRQWVLKREELKFDIDYQDHRNTPKKEEEEEEIQSQISEDNNKAFDLEKGPLFRATLFQLENEKYIFYYNMHHIICDGWSLDVLAKDVIQFYEAYNENKTPQLQELNIQYKDYSTWQLAQLEGDSNKTHKTYWLNQLKGELPLLDLPSTKQRPLLKTHNGQRLLAYLDADTTEKLHQYTKDNGGSLFMGVLAVWNVLMHKYTSQKDLIVGTPVAGRENADLENQIGFYLNTLALRNEINPEKNFHAFFNTLKENTFKSYSHQIYPFDQLVADLELQRDTSRSVVFDIMLVLQNNGKKVEELDLNSKDLKQIVSLGEARSKFDLNIMFEEIGDYLSLHIIFNPDVYDEEMVKGLINHFKLLSNELITNPKEKISKIEFLSQKEKQEQLIVFNDTTVDYQQHKTNVDLFEEQVLKTPDNIAVVFPQDLQVQVDDEQLTYRELNEKSNQLARYLQKNYKIEPDDLVGIKQGLTQWMMISILGVLKSGGAYVPIDKDYPQDRIDFIEQDINSKICLNEAEIQRFKESADNYSIENVDSKVQSNNLAYVIYTSGSTGKSKGVMIEHRSLINYTNWFTQAYSINEFDSSVVLSSPAFDGILTCIYGCILNGGTIHFLKKFRTHSVTEINRYIQQKGITFLKATPSHFNLLMNDISAPNLLNKSAIRLFISGGDKAGFNYINKIVQESNIELINHYGPTETTVGSSTFTVSKENIGEFEKHLSIGKPISNTQIYILNKVGSLQPHGVIGEICIGGSGIARGYLNREELTKEKFIVNPFKEQEHLYKTGDIGRWLPDGNIELLGRIDDQVKIRGHRIELGEIVHALCKHEAIEEAEVLSQENEHGENELVAYIIAKEEQTINNLRFWLRETLPEYMLPAHYVQLSEFPLTPHGKIDRKSLPSVESSGLASGAAYIAPKTDEEKLLASVWGDVLKRKEISLKDSFYNLGGDSIKSIQVVARLKQHGYKIKLEQILRTPVLEELSRLLQRSIQTIDQGEVKGKVAFTPIQKWFFTADAITNRNHFNQSVLLASNERIDNNILEKCLADITKHHATLRMVFKESVDFWEQINQDEQTPSFTLDFHDLQSDPDASLQMAQIGEKLQSSISLTNGPLFKAVHFRLKDRDRIGLIIHHLVVDGVSWRIILEDLLSLYKSYEVNEKPTLPLKTDSFQKWTVAQKEYANGNEISKERSFWEGIGQKEIPKFPSDKELANNESVINDSVKSCILDKTTTELLQTQVHSTYNTEINDILMTGLGRAIKDVFGIDKSVIKMEGHGREDLFDGIDITRTVGWFTTTYPFILDVSNVGSQVDHLIAIKEALRSIPNKGIGYGILKYLNDEGIRSDLIPEIGFNYLGDFGENVANDENSLFEYASESIGATTDKTNGNSLPLDVSGILLGGELNLSISYSKARYNDTTIEDLIKAYQKNLTVLIADLAQNQESYLTPSDLSFKGLSINELLALNSDNTLEDVYELSPLQEGIYYHWLSENSNSLYFEQSAYRIHAEALDIEKLKCAYDGLIARHAVLRTNFNNEYAGRSLQIVAKNIPGNFLYQQLEDNVDKEKIIKLIKQEDRDKGFDLSAGSQMRLSIVALSESEYEFIWSHHHILMDGWCVSVLINDFNQLLNVEMEVEAVNLPPVVPYSNYINWLNTIDKGSTLNYWKLYLEDYSEVAEVPFKIKSKDYTYVESRRTLKIEGALFENINTLCNTLGVTNNTFIQGVWGYLLSTYNNTNDVVFGSVVSGRPAELSGVEEMIGLFINTIPVRVKYDSEDTPTKLLKALQEQAIQSNAHHYMNLSEVQAQSDLGMNLIDHIMIYQNYAVKELEGEGVFNSQKESSLSIESMDVFEQTNYDLNIVIGSFSDSLSLNILSNSNLYEQQSIKRLVVHFENLIKAFTEKPAQPLWTFNYLSQEEERELLETLNDTAVAYPKDKTVVDLFEIQVQKTPNNVALLFPEESEYANQVSDGKTITYSELNEKANQLARYLQENYRIQSDDLVSIKQEKSEWLLISILAVLKSGGAYVPIDPEYPQDRIEYIERDTNCKVCINDDELNKFKINQASFSKEDLKIDRKENNLAYVIYTSGSTGKPKGVQLTHENLNQFLNNALANFHSEKTIVLPFVASASFDISVFQIFLPLINGGKSILVSKKDFQNAAKFTEILSLSTALDTVPAMYEALIDHIQAQVIPESFNGIENVFVGGDKIPNQLLTNLRKVFSAAKIWVTYGPTEGTIFCTNRVYQNTNTAQNYNGAIIGTPSNNVAIYILNAEDKLQPKGVIGEICIGGNGVAKGYLNQKELTEEKFIESPFKQGTRLYKTGDLGRWTTDGQIEFMGRKDDQVKIRGYRIELGEIEQAIAKLSKIEQVVVIVRENRKLSAEKEIIAYFTIEAEPNGLKEIRSDKDDLSESSDVSQANITELRTQLRDVLPNYMIPAYFVQLDNLPLTSNGKIDRKSLPDPQFLEFASGVEFVVPTSEIEKKLVAIWERILEREKVGIKDDFFNLGGHSLKALRMITAIKSEFDLKLDIRNLFQNTTIESLAIELERINWLADNQEKDLSDLDIIEI